MLIIPYGIFTFASRKSRPQQSTIQKIESIIYSHHHSFELLATLDIIGNLLRKRVHCRLRMTWRQEWESARVYHSQTLHTKHPCMGVDNRHGITLFAHGTRSGSMPQLEGILTKERKYLFIRRDVGTWCKELRQG